MTTDKIRESFLTFNVQGVTRQLPELPKVSEKTRKVMEECNYFGPQLPSKELKLCESKVQLLMKDIEKGENFKATGFVLMAMGVALLVTGIIFGPTIFDQVLLGVFGIFSLAGGVGGFINADTIKSNRRRTWKELESLKPKIQRYVEDFALYYQIHGQRLQSVLQEAFDERHTALLSGKEPFTEENVAIREELREALGQIKKANEIAQSFLPEPTQQYYFTTDAQWSEKMYPLLGEGFHHDSSR